MCPGCTVQLLPSSQFLFQLFAAMRPWLHLMVACGHPDSTRCWVILPVITFFYLKTAAHHHVRQHRGKKLSKGLCGAVPCKSSEGNVTRLTENDKKEERVTSPYPPLKNQNKISLHKMAHKVALRDMWSPRHFGQFCLTFYLILVFKDMVPALSPSIKITIKGQSRWPILPWSTKIRNLFHIKCTQYLQSRYVWREHRHSKMICESYYWEYRRPLEASSVSSWLNHLQKNSPDFITLDHRIEQKMKSIRWHTKKKVSGTISGTLRAFS